MDSFESEIGRVMRADDLPERPVDAALGDVRRRAGVRRRNRTVGVVSAAAASAAVSSNVPWADEVIYFISGEEVARLSDQEAADIDASPGPAQLRS